MEYSIESFGNKQMLKIKCLGCKYSSSIADSPQCMSEVIDLLRKYAPDIIVLSSLYNKTYSKEQVEMLKEIANVANEAEALGLWSLKLIKTKDKEFSKIITPIQSKIVEITHHKLLEDPILAYTELLKIIKTLKDINNKFNKKELEEVIKKLEYISSQLSKTKLIRLFIEAVKKKIIGPELLKSRLFYKKIFAPSIVPSFVESKLLETISKDLTILDTYKVEENVRVIIYGKEDSLMNYYYLEAPEYSLLPSHIYLFELAREYISKNLATLAPISDITKAREYLESIYYSTILDLATENEIEITPKEAKNLAKIVARHTIGYGILELLFKDRKITDIYVDAPIGSKPIYLQHSEYGFCETNIILSESEAKSFASKLRALSGRPFDEAHPVLDYDLPDLSVRVAAICPPLSPAGIAFAFRLHKPTPWTLPQFLDKKMLNPLAAGMLSFFVDSQATILIAGSRGAGKTSLLTSLILEIPQNSRILVQEDTFEIPVEKIREYGFNIQRLKTRSPIGGTTYEVSPEDALRTALRLGDSAIIVGEIRSLEAKVLFEAMRVGAAGNTVMGTIHGDSAYSVWDRVVNDLEVPTTSFKAADFVIVAAPIRPKGALKRYRRLISITEVKKHWNKDPYEEGGFVDLMKYDANKDELELIEESIKESEFFIKISKLRGLSMEEIWNEIEMRGKMIEFITNAARKLNMSNIMEGDIYSKSKNLFLIMKDKYLEKEGILDKEFFENWKKKTLEKIILPLKKQK